jgi:myosin V
MPPPPCSVFSEECKHSAVWFLLPQLITSALSLVRRRYRTDVKHVVWMQSCLRRRLARRELKALKQEARSVGKFKDIAYKLENKVVELTQSLQTRTREKKALESQISELEEKLQTWMGRHEDADSRAKLHQADLQSTKAELTKRDELLLGKADVEKRLEEAIAKTAEREQTVQNLTEELARQAMKMEEQQKAIDSAPKVDVGDSSVIATLKNEVSSLREQLNRANALNALTKGAREPPSPSFAPTLRPTEPGYPAGINGVSPSKRHQRRHSSAGVYAVDSGEYRNSFDELMIDAKRSQNPRAVSVAYNGQDGLSRYRGSELTDIVDDDPAEEKIKIMMNAKHLDEDVLEGLIRGLKIPTPNLQQPSHVKEILFPANLISLVTNEMWKYGLIPESERFLANVMQSIQAHVMVSASARDKPTWILIVPYSHSRARMQSFLGFSGSQMFTRCSPLSASPRAT